MTLVVAAVGASFGLGVILLAGGWIAGPPPARGRRDDLDAALRPLAAATVGGAAVLALTGWVVAGIAAALAVGVFVGRARHRRRPAKVEQARIEGLAGWCEQLRDLLSADHGIVGTVRASVRTCPDAIRPEVDRLATRLERRRPSAALQQFADDLDDPSADLVASVLMLATTRSSRTSELLSELATTIRDRAAMRLRVEAERAGHRSEARFIVGFTLAVVAGLVVFGSSSSFLGAYDSGEGQLVLVIVCGFFAIALRWLARLTRFSRPARFLALLERPGGTP